MNLATSHRRHAVVVCVLFLLAACGGGGGGDDNHAPVLVTPNASQVAVHRHPYNYDAAQGGRTFSDPDGDQLRYEVTLGHTSNPTNDPNPPVGLGVHGTAIRGAAQETKPVVVTIVATDRFGLKAQDQFTINVLPNSAPVASADRAAHLVNVGSMVDIDAATFSDADGDALTYDVQLRGAPRGLTLAGTRVSGIFDSIGVVEVTVTARDPYEGVGTSVLHIAAPGPEPGSPTLPETSYVYRDEELDLPYDFRLSSELQIPLWDTQPPDNRTTNAGATLGRVLFYDKRLSITNTVACASCHQQTTGFAQPQRFSVGALGVPTKRNAMALANVRYNLHEAWFWDMRARSLRELVLQPLQNAEELGSPLPLVEEKLRATDFYPPLFEAAFGSPEITRERVARALAQFLQALISYRSKFDRAFNTTRSGGPPLVLDPQELQGLQVFRSNSCEHCHEQTAHASVHPANNGLDEVITDPGVQDMILAGWTRGVFRPASLRNIALTAPYMHDGRFATLREVIDHYDHGVKPTSSVDPLLHTLDGTQLRLNLTEQQKDALEVFLRTLTDEAFLTDPKFSDPFP